MSGIIPFKVGGDWQVPLEYTPTEGLAPANLANTTITSQIRQADGTLIATFTATKDADNMGFTLSVASTAAWPYDLVAFWDIKLDDTQYPSFYTETAQVRLIRPQTR